MSSTASLQTSHVPCIRNVLAETNRELRHFLPRWSWSRQCLLSQSLEGASSLPDQVRDYSVFLQPLGPQDVHLLHSLDTQTHTISIWSGNKPMPHFKIQRMSYRELVTTLNVEQTTEGRKRELRPAGKQLTPWAKARRRKLRLGEGKEEVGLQEPGAWTRSLRNWCSGLGGVGGPSATAGTSEWVWTHRSLEHWRWLQVRTSSCS